jgi:hypothetical protein
VIPEAAVQEIQRRGPADAAVQAVALAPWPQKEATMHPADPSSKAAVGA